MTLTSFRTFMYVGSLLTAMTMVTSAAAKSSRHGGVTATAHFVVTDDANVTGDSGYLNNGATNDAPNAILFMALNNTPGGVCGCAVVTKPLGVWYDSSKQQWAVFTEDASGMPSQPSFNILVVQKSSQSVFVQHATPSNTQGNHTFINAKLLNGNSHAGIQVTQNFNPGGALAGTYNAHPVGVEYYPSKKKWAVFNEDNASMPIGAAFDVMVGQAPSNGGKTSLATVTSYDHHIGTILVNSSVSNGNPNNISFETQVFNPGGKGAIGDAHPIEVAYPNPGTHIFKETLNNADFTTAPVGASFNVLIFG